MNVSNHVKIGNGVKVQNNVSIYEGVELEDYVFCGPSMVFTNDLTPRAKYPKGSAGYKKTLLKEGSTVGANATIVCGHTIGKWAMIAAGAVVTKNVKNNYRCCFKTAQNENGFVGKNKNQVEKINKKERYTGFFLTKISKNPCVTAFFVLFLNLTSNEKEKKIET